MYLHLPSPFHGVHIHHRTYLKLRWSLQFLQPHWNALGRRKYCLSHLKTHTLFFITSSCSHWHQIPWCLVHHMAPWVPDSHNHAAPRASGLSWMNALDAHPCQVQHGKDTVGTGALRWSWGFPDGIFQTCSLQDLFCLCCHKRNK